MKTHSLLLLSGLAVPLVATPPATADFTGLSVTARPNEFGLLVCNVYADFDQPGDLLQAVAGTTETAAFISVIDGTFFQHLIDSDRPPNPLLFNVKGLESLRYDTFVTIGVQSFNGADPGVPEGQPADNMILVAGWVGFDPDILDLGGGVGNAWFVVPDEPQGDAFNPDFVAGDGRVLIAQVATADGAGFEGMLLVQYISEGVTQSGVGEFIHLSSPPCPWDCGNGDGQVETADFLAVLAQWGQAGTSCDFDGNGVDTVDFLALIAAWGLCP